ncbi:MAG: restriction system protein [Solirubrobacterales bacterium]|jgi:hypothetical protein|nr:restriction system protein [Solirubrobacterales bacterium]
MPTIELSPPTYQRLLSQAESFEDTPETVIERLLDRSEGIEPALKGNVAHDRRQEEEALLPEGEYWLPILEILAEVGGSARGSDVISELENRIGDRFSTRDKDVLEMGEVRWRNRARFARLRMKERGLISNESPRGRWEITEKGHEFLIREREYEPSAKGERETRFEDV